MIFTVAVGIVIGIIIGGLATTRGLGVVPAVVVIALWL